MSQPPKMLPLLPLLKDKKYHRPHLNKQNILKYDIDDMMIDVVKKHPEKQYRKKSNMPRSMAIIIAKNGIEVPAGFKEVKGMKMQIGQYIDKMGHEQIREGDDYSQFLRLAGESQDYLQYYIKTHFKQTSTDLPSPLTSSKSLILSLLKSQYPLLTTNPPQISSRLLLTLDINPLNDFHLVTWDSFSIFRKMLTHKYSRAQGRKFLVKYLMIGREEILREEFWGLVGAVLRKIGKVINENNVERIVERVKELGSFVPQKLNKETLQQLMNSKWFFIWDQLVHLIFTP